MFGIALWQALSAACILAALTGEWLVIRASAGLLINWGVLTAYASATGDQYNWAANAAVDYTTAVTTLLLIGNRWQALLMGTFAVGFTFHISYGLSERLHEDMVRYWWRFHYLAWAQVVFMLTWAGGELVGCFMRWGFRGRGVSALASRPALVRDQTAGTES